MTTIVIRTNPLDSSLDQVFNDVKNVREFLFNHFEVWPQNAVIYADKINEQNKVSLETSKDVESLANLNGAIFVVIYPSGVALIATLVWAANVAVAIFTGGKKKESTSDQTAQRKEVATGSPNNGLTARSNTSRINQRIPEIFGAVRSIPDLLLNSYTEYIANQQVEYGYYCVGRGQYEISDIRDGDTMLNQASRSSSAEVYGPGTSPQLGSPQLAVGKSINAEFVSVKLSTSITGQKLFAPNTTSVYSAYKFKFYRNGRIQVDNEREVPNGITPETGNIDFTTYFQAGDKFEVSGSNNTDGLYDIASVDSNFVTLIEPEIVNSYWTNFATDGTWQIGGMNLITPGDRKVGLFIVENCNKIFCNFVAENGLYFDDGVQPIGTQVAIQITAQEINSADVLIGGTYSVNIILNGGSSASRIAVTGKLSLPYVSRWKVYAKRTSNTNLTFDGKVVDSVEWESLMAVSSITLAQFGNVTTIRTATYVTPGTLGLKDRKLNCLAKRIIPVRQTNGSYVDGITSKFADILRFVCLDPKIGNRDVSELDLTNFYDTQAAIQSYFGTAKAIEFNYTFDEDNFSFEETVSVICEAVFCSAFRQGSTIKLHFEKETNDSVLLFNHRNKIPNSETRTVRFGNNEDKDGVELEYVEPKDGAKIKYYLPIDQSAVNPEKISQLGITNKLQAYFHAHRVFNRICYQNCMVEFDGLQESQMLTRNQRIQVADNTRTQTFDGEVVVQNGSTLTLSQDFIFEVGKTYTIFLQNVDGTVISKGITAGTYKNQVVLANTTNISIAVADDLYSKSTYEIVENTSGRKRAFLVDEKSSKDNFVVTLKAINYDDRYYDGDDDFLTGVVDANGNII